MITAKGTNKTVTRNLSFFKHISKANSATKYGGEIPGSDYDDLATILYPYRLKSQLANTEVQTPLMTVVKTPTLPIPRGPFY